MLTIKKLFTGSILFVLAAAAVLISVGLILGLVYSAVGVVKFANVGELFQYAITVTLPAILGFTVVELSAPILALVLSRRQEQDNNIRESGQNY